jgi:hypothetical protein
LDRLPNVEERARQTFMKSDQYAGSSTLLEMKIDLDKEAAN